MIYMMQDRARSLQDRALQFATALMGVMMSNSAVSGYVRRRSATSVLHIVLIGAAPSPLATILALFHHPDVTVARHRAAGALAAVTPAVLREPGEDVPHVRPSSHVDRRAGDRFATSVLSLPQNECISSGGFRHHVLLVQQRLRWQVGGCSFRLPRLLAVAAVL
jgi:hypothetical protein